MLTNCLLMLGIILIIQEFNTNDSNAFILKTKAFCEYFNAFLEPSEKFEPF